MSPLSASEIEAALDKLNSPLNAPWRLRDGQLHKDFTYVNFVAAFGFMARVAIVAEKLDHHPDWCNEYATVRINLTTHDAGGITQLDFDLAEQIERNT